MLTSRRVARYGWSPDLPDHRDLLLTTPAPRALPAKVTLRDRMPPVWDQGQLGSCTAHALAAAFEHAASAQGLPVYTPSRLFIYYGERVIEGTVDTDAGAMLRDGAKVLAHSGAPPEALWPYDITRFARKPPADAFAAGLKDHAVKYLRVGHDAAHMKACLAAGWPFVIGFTVYQSFESDTVAKTGMVPMPTSDESTIGGHAVLVVGYDDEQGLWEVRNSWGAGWGDGGYFWMPQPYLTSRRLASDLWTIRLVAEAVVDGA